MNMQMLVVLMSVMLALSACVIEPYGGERRDHFRSDHRDFQGDRRDFQGDHRGYDRRVWHE